MRETEDINIHAIRNMAVTLAIILFISIPLLQRIKDIHSAQDITPFQLAHYLNDNIRPDNVIESYEPEIVFLSEHTYHQPSLKVLMQSVRHVQLGQPYPDNFYEIEKYHPTYLIDGPFSKWTELYTKDLEDEKYVLVESIGPYDLYKIETK